MKVQALWKWVLLAVLVFVSAEIQAQQSNQTLAGHHGASPQIVEAIDEGKLLSLPGSPLSPFRTARDQGSVASDMVLGRLHLALKRSKEQESALQSLIHSQQDIHSPLYHHWLTPEEFGEQFGPAQQDIDTVTAWLQSKGIKVASVAKGRSSIEFSATHRQIQNAFHTELHWFETKSGRQYSNVSSPRIPAALGPVVAGIGSLSSSVSRPLSHVVPQTSGNGVVSGNPPSYLSGSTNYLAPGDFWTIYNATPAETGGITGAGVTIGIAGRSEVAASDVSAFRSAYLGNSYSGSFQNVINGPDPGTPSGDDVENALDVEWAGALAPNAKVILVSSQTDGEDGVLLSAQYLVDNNLADIVSVSYGECESFLWTGGVLEYSDAWEQAAAQGITVVVAAGDNGSASCDDDQYPQAEFGLQVSGLASTPYNVAVGGTEFVEQGDSWAASVGSTPLPGTSALGYIPEKVWNESQTFSTLYAGSGGVSNCYFSQVGNPYDTAGCGGGWPKPDWQAGVTGIPADGARDLPDLSFTAALHDGYVITLQGKTSFVGGTSAATPSFAGVMALVNQKAGGRQGMANYQLYALAAQEFGAPGAENQTNLSSCNANLPQSSGNSCVFYDVTSGGNAVPCQGDTENCSATTSGTTGMMTGYAAGAGYDLASGLGSMNITNLVNAWSVAPKGNSPSTTSLQISPTSAIVHGSQVSVSITVAPTSGSGTPSGSVSLVANGVGVATVQLSNGSWSGNIAALPGGDYQVTAQYSGDATYAGSTSPQVHVDVTPEPSTTTVSVTAKDAQLGNSLALTSVPYGSNVIMNATVKGQSGIGFPNNAVSFSVGGNQYTGLMDTAGHSAFTVTTLPPGGYSLTASYFGDASFAQSTSATPAQFTIVPAATAVSLSSGTLANGATPVTAIVSATSFGNAPTGNVAFFVNGAQVGTATVQPDGAAAQSWAFATFNIAATMLNAGSNAITAQYVGDANYAQSTLSAPVTIVPNNLTLTAPTPPAAPSMAQEFKTGAQVSVSAVILGSFQNLQVQWAPGINPASGWSSSGITVNANLSQPVRNVPIATWDTTSMSTEGYYTLCVSVTSAGVTNTATTFVYLEPDLMSSNWPLGLPDTTYFNVAPVPMTDSSGNTNLLFGTFGPGAQLLKSSIDGSSQASFPLSLGSWYEPAAANLHFIPGDDLIYPDGNAVIVVRPDGTKDTLAPPASMSNMNFNFQYAQPVVDDVDGDSIPEVVTVGLGPGPTPWTTTAYLFAWRNNGQQLNNNFPVAIPDWDLDLVFAPARVLVGDVDGDGAKEFVVLEGTSGTSFTPRLFAADGTPKPWNAATLQQAYSYQMALADLDHNGKLETILESAPVMGSSSPANLHVLNPDGSERPGWPQPLAYYGSGDSIAVGDLNRDGSEEIVVSHGGVLSVFKTDGTAFWPNWTNPYGGFGPAVLADVNGDGYPEIVAPFGKLSQDPTFPTYNVFQLLVLDRTGATIGSWNLTGVNEQQIAFASATAGDFLGDGKSEIALGYAVSGLGYSLITQMGAEVLSPGWSYNAAASDWPMLHRNSNQSAVLRRASPTVTTLSYAAKLSNGVSSTTFTIAVAPASGGSGVPTGTVNLIDGDQNIGACILSSGSCSITPPLAASAHSLTAGYVGDLNFEVSYSASLSLQVNSGTIPTTTALTISPSGGSLAAGSSYTLTATVTPSSGATVPTGSVVFTIGSATQTVALNASGIATYTGTAPVSSGQLILSAAYQGSSEFSTSTSNTLTENIVTLPTTTALTISPSGGSLAAGSSYTMTATVTPSSGATIPTGSVVFTVGASTQTVALNASGIATYTGAAPVSSGQLILSAAYLGSSEFSTSTSNTLTESIVTNPVPAITSMSPAYATAGGATFTLTVNGSGFVAGSTAYWGSTALTTQFVTAGQLSAQVTAAEIAAAGPTPITVQSPAPGGGASNALQFEVDSAGTGTASAPVFTSMTASVSAGAAATYPVTLPSSATNVSVTCLNLPAGAACGYSSTTGAVTITTSAFTPSGKYQVTVVFAESLPGAASSFVMLPILLLPLLLMRRKMLKRNIWLSASLALVMLVGAMASTGCGGGGGASSTPVPPPNPTHQMSSSGAITLTIQ